MPLWCPGSDTARGNEAPHPHHRIVRIPPGESVVLNSAERAPFLLLVEVLHDDLDFEPTKQSNKEVLRNIVLKEADKKGFPGGGTTPLPSAQLNRPTGSSQDLDVAGGPSDQAEPPASLAVVPPTPTAVPPEPESDEEIDLVEQLYGNDQPLSKMIDFSESIVLPPAPKNKELDLVTWSRASPMPQSSPYLGSPHSRSPSRGTRIALERANSTPILSAPSTPEPDGPSSSSKVLSLDEYSERMRTAAIMLAQLNEGGRSGPVTASPRPDSQADPSSTYSFCLSIVRIFNLRRRFLKCEALNVEWKRDVSAAVRAAGSPQVEHPGDLCHS